MSCLIRHKIKRGVIPQHIPLLKSFTDSLNSKRTKWACTYHALNRIDSRFDRTTILNHIENTEKRLEHVYEYYMKYNMVEKACYAFQFNTETLGIVCLKNRVLVTVYTLNNARLKSIASIWHKILLNT